MIGVHVTTLWSFLVNESRRAVFILKRWFLRRALSAREKAVLVQSIGAYQSFLKDPEFRREQQVSAEGFGVRVPSNDEFDELLNRIGEFESE